MTDQQAPSFPQAVSVRTWLRVPINDSIAEGNSVRIDNGNQRFSGVVTYVNYQTGRLEASGEWAVIQ